MKTWEEIKLNKIKDAIPLSAHNDEVVIKLLNDLVDFGYATARETFENKYSESEIKMIEARANELRATLFGEQVVAEHIKQIETERDEFKSLYEGVNDLYKCLKLTSYTEEQYKNLQDQIVYLNKNCISLFLHEQRMKQVETKRDELKVANSEMKFELEAKQRPLGEQVLRLTLERDEAIAAAKGLVAALQQIANARIDQDSVRGFKGLKIWADQALAVYQAKVGKL